MLTSAPEAALSVLEVSRAATSMLCIAASNRQACAGPNTMSTPCSLCVISSLMTAGTRAGRRWHLSTSDDAGRPGLNPNQKLARPHHLRLGSSRPRASCLLMNPFLITYPLPFPQHVFLDFTGGGFRQCSEFDDFWAFEMGHTFPAKVDDLLFTSSCPRF